MPYIKDLWISNNQKFMKDVIKPEFMDFVDIKDIYLSYSTIGTNKNVKGRAK